jgi:hypothetical protein
MSTRSTTTGFTVSELGSIERFLAKRTVPVVYCDDNHLGVQGTGVFYVDSGKTFFITAGHVVDRVDATRLGVPAGGDKNTYVLHFGDCRVHHPKDTDKFDVAAIELQDPELIELLKRGWVFLDDSCLADSSVIPKQYVVAGYPNAMVANKSGQLTPSALMHLYTRPYEGDVRGSRSELDIFLRYNREATGMYPLKKVTPMLEGVSGAAVYAVMDSRNLIWTPENVFKIIGIQVAYLHSSYIRVKSWALVSHLISMIHER